MKILRSLGMALAMLGGLALGVASLVVAPILRNLANVCDRAACGIAKLDLELAHKFADKVPLSDDVLANMQRESHGFRQSSAVEPEGHQTWRTA